MYDKTYIIRGDSPLVEKIMARYRSNQAAQ